VRLCCRSNSYQPTGSRVVVTGSKPLSAFSNLTDIFAGKVLGCATPSTTTMSFCTGITGNGGGSSSSNNTNNYNNNNGSSSNQASSRSPLHQSLCSNRTSSSSLASLGEDAITSAEMQAVAWNTLTASSESKYAIFRFRVDSARHS